MILVMDVGNSNIKIGIFEGDKLLNSWRMKTDLAQTADEYGICGTINLDYRSLYLHHECAVWMFRARAVEQMSRVFDETLARSAEVTLDAVRRRAWYRKIVQSLLRVFAPLL